MALPLSTNGRDLAAFLETSTGRTVLEVFAKKSGWTLEAIREELFVNARLAAYFVKVARDAIDAVEAEAAALRKELEWDE